jgi:hypothetical protein
MDDELRSEYDLSELLKGGVRGKYAEQCREGTKLVEKLELMHRAAHDRRFLADLEDTMSAFGGVDAEWWEREK